jgi:alpha-galactosidase
MEWGIDFIKADDMSRPYHKDEIQGISKALINCGREIVLSLSPGDSPIQSAKHLAENSNMWRISNDFWDDWRLLKKQFALCKSWSDYKVEGHWPDCDMLILGKLRITGPDNYTTKELNLSAKEITNEYSRFTTDEKYTMMNLWCIFRSPLMVGGYLPENDSLTLKLLTNSEVIAVNQNSSDNKEVFSDGEIIIWSAGIPGSNDKYIAVFNISDEKRELISISWSQLGLTGEYVLRDLWKHNDLGSINNNLNLSLDRHASVLLKFTSK